MWVVDAPAETRRPNFVFILTDDISPDDLSVYGNSRIQTPNLSRMASKGLVFDNAYLTISSCSPSRCSMITGRYPHNTGAPELHIPLPENQITFIQSLHDAGYHTVLSGKNHMGDPKVLGFDLASNSAPAGSEKWLNHLRDRPEDKPFFCWFASSDAHRGFTLNDKAPHYAADEIPVPPMLADGPETRKDLTGYYHEVSRTDYYVGQVLDELQRQQILDTTYVVYCSDNGRPFPRCKTYLYDSGIKTPLLIIGPGVQAGRTNALVSSIDFAATFLDLAGVEKPESVQGVSFQPVFANPSTTVREVAFAERNWHVYQNHARAVRTGDWLYVWNAWPERHNVAMESSSFSFPAVKELWDMAAAGKLSAAQKRLTEIPQPAEMLFHVPTDPHQFVNLIDAPQHQPIVEQMRSLLNAWQTETGDSLPENPTPDRQPLHTSKPSQMKRGELPGTSQNAEQNNHPGPIHLGPIQPEPINVR
jgi:arylsulfatase A-like enzyme